MQYTIKISIADRDVLALTNIGAYTQLTTDDGKAAIYRTVEHSVFVQWCAELEAAGRAYERL